MDTLVLIPGLGSDFGVWQRTIDALGLEVACRVGDTLQDDHLAGMARRVLSEAPETFSLAGVSMGGMVALEIMRLAPGRVRHLALVDTNARADTEEQGARRREVNEFVLQAAEHMDVLAELSLPSLVHQANAASVRQSIVEMSVRVGAATYVRQNLAVMSRDDLRPVLVDITVPTSIIVGEDDQMTPVELSRDMQQSVRGASLTVIPECGHLPPIEKPDIMASLLQDLLVR